MMEIAHLGPSPNVFRGMIKLHEHVTRTVHRFLSVNTYSSQGGDSLQSSDEEGGNVGLVPRGVMCHPELKRLQSYRPKLHGPRGLQ